MSFGAFGEHLREGFVVGFLHRPFSLCQPLIERRSMIETSCECGRPMTCASAHLRDTMHRKKGYRIKGAPSLCKPPSPSQEHSASSNSFESCKEELIRPHPFPHIIYRRLHTLKLFLLFSDGSTNFHNGLTGRHASASELNECSHTARPTDIQQSLKHRG